MLAALAQLPDVRLHSLPYLEQQQLLHQSGQQGQQQQSEERQGQLGQHHQQQQQYLSGDKDLLGLLLRQAVKAVVDSRPQPRL